MIRAAHPHEIRLLPQIENAADRRFARVGLQLVVDMPGHSIAALEHGAATACSGSRPRRAATSSASR